MQLKVMKKEETIQRLQAESRKPIPRNEDDVKMIQNLEETVGRLQKEIRIINERVSALFNCLLNVKTLQQKTFYFV